MSRTNVIAPPLRWGLKAWLSFRRATAPDAREAMRFGQAIEYFEAGNLARAVGTVPALDRRHAQMLLGAVLADRTARRKQRRRKPARSGDPAAIARVAVLLDVIEDLDVVNQTLPRNHAAKPHLERAANVLLDIIGPPLGDTRRPDPTARYTPEAWAAQVRFTRNRRQP